MFKNENNEGIKNMLETSQERVKLLKAGISIKKIENIYIQSNNFTICRFPVFLIWWKSCMKPKSNLIFMKCPLFT